MGRIVMVWMRRQSDSSSVLCLDDSSSRRPVASAVPIDPAAVNIRADRFRRIRQSAVISVSERLWDLRDDLRAADISASGAREKSFDIFT